MKDKRLTVIFLLLILYAHYISAGSVPKPLLWKKALAGEITSMPAQGPSGDVYVIAGDRALHSVNPLNGNEYWVYRPGGKLKNIILTAPDGTIYIENERKELFAVTPGGTGRWKLNLGNELSALPTVNMDGSIIVPVKNKKLLCVSRFGKLLWNISLSGQISASPVTGIQNNTWVPLINGEISVINPSGTIIKKIDTGFQVSVIVSDNSGRIIAGGYNGEICIIEDKKIDFNIRTDGSRISALLTADNNFFRVFSANGNSYKIDYNGRISEKIKLPAGGGRASEGSDGSIFFPLSDGSILALRTNGEKDVYQRGPYLSEPLLSREGALIAGGGDWFLYAWKESPPAAGWSQYRGGARRSGSLSFNMENISFEEAEKDPAFFFREKAALSESPEERMELIKELGKYSDYYSMKKDFPWVDYLLEDLASGGTSRVSVNSSVSEPVSYPSVRAEAYRLIGNTGNLRLRNIIISSLRTESDLYALGEGFTALGKIGSDWDGASTDIIAVKFRNIENPPRNFIIKTASAFSLLVRYNGKISSSSGWELFNQLMKYSSEGKGGEELEKILRTISGL